MFIIEARIPQIIKKGESKQNKETKKRKQTGKISYSANQPLRELIPILQKKDSESQMARRKRFLWKQTSYIKETFFPGIRMQEIKGECSFLFFKIIMRMRECIV